MKNAFYILMFCTLSVSCGSEFTRVAKSHDNEYKYKMAEKFYAQKKYAFAQQLFTDLFPYVKGTPRFEDMYYKNAYAYYYQKDYLNAEDVFKTYLENFPNNPRAEECEYMRAYCYYKQSPKAELDQGPTTKAMGFMQAFISVHPSSTRVKEATEIIDLCRAKLEDKDYKTAKLYYDLGYVKAASVCFSSMADDYPDTNKGDHYKLEAIKSYFRYAELSVTEKQQERFDKVIAEAVEFTQSYPSSKYLKEVMVYRTNSENNIKKIKNEQAKTPTQR